MISHRKPHLIFYPTLPIAHRANYGNQPTPENTLAAVILAHKHGIKWIECDVKLTSDGIATIILKEF